MVDAERERRLGRCDSAIRPYRYGLLQRGDRWRLVAIEGPYGRPPLPPEAWRDHPEWMTLDELERCLGVSGD